MDEELGGELRTSLVNNLKKEGVIKSKSVEDAFLKIQREDFVWKQYAASAYFDEPVPLGETGQTISAPHMAAIMLEEAELAPRMKVLEVGAGSGYNAALIGHIVGKGVEPILEPLVITIERNSQLVAYARENLRKAKLERIVEVVFGDGSRGYPEGSGEMLYDRIIVTAGAQEIPVSLEKQLRVEGILLIPVGVSSYQTLVKVRKIRSSSGRLDLKKQTLMPVMFVPLIPKEPFSEKPKE